MTALRFDENQKPNYPVVMLRSVEKDGNLFPSPIDGRQ
jgi:hypothetical protein